MKYDGIGVRHGGVALNWALDGHGVQLLPNYNSPDADIYAIYAKRHRTSVRVKALIDFVAAAFKR